MKNRYILVLLILLVSSHVSAKESGYSLSLSGVGMSMDYSEYLDDGSLFNTEESSLNGIMGAELKLTYTGVLENGDYIQSGFNISGLGGETQYTGGIIGSGLGYGSYLNATKDTIIDMEAEYKYTHRFNDTYAVVLGVGFGSRSWRRELSASQIEIYRWYSLRPKIGLLYSEYKFSIGGLVEYQYGINPEMSLDIPGTYVILDLGSADIVKFTLPLTYQLSEKWIFFTEYVYEKQTIEKSNIVEGWLEPRSEAYNQYLKFGAEFKF